MMLAAHKKARDLEKISIRMDKIKDSEHFGETKRAETFLPYLTPIVQNSRIADELKNRITRIVESTCRAENSTGSSKTCKKSRDKKPAALLDFCGLNLGYAGVLHLLNEIHDYGTSHVVQVDFSGCALDEKGMSIVYRIVKLCKNVTDVNLSRNNLGRSGITWVSKLLQNADICYLSLTHNALGDKDMEVFFPALVESDTIISLDLSYNILGPNTGNLLTKFMPVCSVKFLNLSHNEIGAEGARQMIDGLQENDSLRELDLSWNYLYDKGMASIADIILTVPWLRKISLNGNFISQVGAQYIAQSIRENFSLQVLNLAQNFIRSHGACALIRAVRSNSGSKLTSMDINGTLVSQEFVTMYRRMQLDKEGFEVKGFCVVNER